jgi:hypothetical protein
MPLTFHIRSAIITGKSGSQTEVPLPNAFLVKAKNGQPLVAKQPESRTKPRLNLGLALLNGLSNFATRAVQFGSFSSDSSSSQANPTIDIASGSIQSLYQQLNSQSQPQPQPSLPAYRIINAGEKVQLIVTQSFQI